MSDEQAEAMAERNPYMPGSGETDTIDGHVVAVRESVAGAVRSLRARAPAVRGNGIFKHPPDWTQDEVDFIVDALKSHVPIHTIANMVHCERHTLSRFINSRPELKQLKDDKYDDMLEEAEYQADRLVKAGNAAIIIHVLNTLGKNTVWSQIGEGGGGVENESRIVMGMIPQDEVDAADERNKELCEKEGGIAGKGVMPDPLHMALMEETVKKEVAEQVAASQPQSIDAEAVQVGGAPYEEEQTEEPQYDSNGFLMMSGATADDPWAAGADSPFGM